MKETIYLIIWEYSDRSGFGVVRAYQEEKECLEDIDILKSLSVDKNFSTKEVQLK